MGTASGRKEDTLCRGIRKNVTEGRKLEGWRKRRMEKRSIICCRHIYCHSCIKLHFAEKDLPTVYYVYISQESVHSVAS